LIKAIIIFYRFPSRQRIYTTRFICMRDACWRWSSAAMIRGMVRPWWPNSKVHTTKVHWGKQNTLKSKKISVLYRKSLVEKKLLARCFYIKTIQDTCFLKLLTVTMTDINLLNIFIYSSRMICSKTYFMYYIITYPTTNK